MAGRSIAAALAAGVLSASLCACGSTRPALRTDTVERAVATSILAERHLHAAVRCPSTTLPIRPGLVFTCLANLDVGSYPVRVTEVGGDGRVRYENPAPLVVLDSAKVERAIARSILTQRHLSARVSCPAEILQRAGLAFTCTATVNGAGHPFDVTQVDGAGNVRYVGR